jgi:hypothetical protein
LVESQQRQWASQAEINSTSDGSEHDERGRWTNIKKGTPLKDFFYPLITSVQPFRKEKEQKQGFKVAGK